jgi:glycosyltransferase involved in cell wall biosynthesis
MPVVVCIPAFNEEATIAKVIIGVSRYAETIIVCDDGSTDMTGEIAQALGAIVITHETNLGKGEALKSLVNQAKKIESRVVLTIDADGQHDPSDIPNLVRGILNGESDIVIGVRSLTAAQMPRHRIIGNRFLNVVVGRMANVKLHDTQSGFRAYSRRALELLPFEQSGLAIESQTIISAAALKLKVKEVPISVQYKGIQRKRSFAVHFSEVIDYLLSKTIADSPLLYLGVPGVFAIILGAAAWLRVLDIYTTTGLIAIGTGLVGLTLLVVGTVTLAASLIIKILGFINR